MEGVCRAVAMAKLDIKPAVETLSWAELVKPWECFVGRYHNLKMFDEA
jgi:hypothetical protein